MIGYAASARVEKQLNQCKCLDGFRRTCAIEEAFHLKLLDLLERHFRGCFPPPSSSLVVLIRRQVQPPTSVTSVTMSQKSC